MSWASHLRAGAEHLAGSATLRLSFHAHGPSISLSIPSPVSFLHSSTYLSFLITAYHSIICLSVLINLLSESPSFPSGYQFISIILVSVCLSILISSCLSVHLLCSNQLCHSCRMAIAQHLPCLGVLLGMSGQHTGPYTSYRSTHRSTLSSQASDLSWISRRRRQASLGSESEMVRMLGPHLLAISSSTKPSSGLHPGRAASETQGTSGRWDAGWKNPSQLPYSVSMHHHLWQVGHWGQRSNELAQHHSEAKPGLNMGLPAPGHLFSGATL